MSAGPRRYWALFVLTLVYAVNIADRFAISTLIEPIKREFHLSDSAVGFLTGMALAIFYVAAGLLLGRLAEQINRRRMIFWAVAAWSAMTALCGVAQGFWQILLARIGIGLGEADGTPPSHSIIADYFPPRERLVPMSIYSIGVSAGLAAGAIGASWCADHYGWRSGLLAFAAVAVPILGLLLTLREPPREIADPEHARRPSSLTQTLRFLGRRRRCSIS